MFLARSSPATRVSIRRATSSGGTSALMVTSMAFCSAGQPKEGNSRGWHIHRTGLPDLHWKSGFDQPRDRRPDKVGASECYAGAVIKPSRAGILRIPGEGRTES